VIAIEVRAGLLRTKKIIFPISLELYIIFENKNIALFNVSISRPPNFFIKIGSLVKLQSSFKKKWEKKFQEGKLDREGVIKDMVITLMLLQNY
jgi:hypothetical protein